MSEWNETGLYPAAGLPWSDSGETGRGLWCSGELSMESDGGGSPSTQSCADAVLVVLAALAKACPSACRISAWWISMNDLLASSWRPVVSKYLAEEDLPGLSVFPDSCG